MVLDWKSLQSCFTLKILLPSFFLMSNQNLYFYHICRPLLISNLFSVSPLKITQWGRNFLKFQTKNIVKWKSFSRKIVLIFAIKITIVLSVENENYPKANSVNLINLISRVYSIVLFFFYMQHLEKHIKKQNSKVWVRAIAEFETWLFLSMYIVVSTRDRYTSYICI